MLLKQVFKKGTIIKVEAIKQQLKFDYQQKQYSKRKPTKLSPD